MGNLPWNEKVPVLSINPDMATRDDIARLASELMEARQMLAALREGVKRVRQEIVAEIHRRTGQPNVGKRGCVRRLDDLLNR